MERYEMVEKLREKVNVSYEEAKEALENSNWDLLDAMVYLEKQGKVEKTIQVVKLQKEGSDSKDNTQGSKGCIGIGEVFGKFFRFLGKVINKGNTNYFEIKKENEKPMKMPITVFVILLLIGFWPAGVLLIIGLFLGYKYSFVGPNINDGKVNDVMSKASDTVQNIKNDFEKGYNDSNQ